MIEGVDVSHALLAGFFAGYLMLVVANWLEGVWGIPRIDFGLNGKRLMGGEEAGWWYVGVASHLLNSMGIALFYAGAIFLNLGDLFDMEVEYWMGPPVGAVFGLSLYLVLPVGLLGVLRTLAGDRQDMSARTFAANLVLHVLYGAALGALYFPIR